MHPSCVSSLRAAAAACWAFQRQLRAWLGVLRCLQPKWLPSALISFCHTAVLFCAVLRCATALLCRYFMMLPANKLELWFALEAERFQVPVLRYALQQPGCCARA
jgi:hypothetical protein